MKELISIVVPCYNEEESIDFFIKELNKVESKLNNLDFEYIFVNDGSKDNTLNILRSLSKGDSKYSYISFSRNFGKEAGLLAGLEKASGDYVSVMDVDLQDPPHLLIEMYEQITTTDKDVITAFRKDRKNEPVLRSWFSELFYKLMNSMTDVEIKSGSRDFRLMTRQVVDAILSLGEVSRFSKGLFNWVGFDIGYISYENVERKAGTTTWSFWSLLSYSIDGFVNFSEKPLTFASFLGILSCFGSFLLILIEIIRQIFFHSNQDGWTSLVAIILFLGGIQLFFLGVVGKYVSKIFLEVKKRPVYIIKESTSYKRNDDEQN